MPDREKVIKDFEDAVRKAHGEGWDFVDLLTEDGFEILSLLKEQEPRVMTLEEVRNAYHSPMWFESNGTFRGQKGFWCLHLGVSPSLHIRLMPAIGEQSTELSLTAYGIVWRCWTSCPTDAQREAEPWN